MRSILSTGYNPARIGWEESIFHTANGYLGVRASPEEQAPPGAFSVRGMYINAFYDIKDIKYGEKLYGFPETQQGIVNLFDVQTIRLCIEGEWLRLDEGEVLKHERELYMDKGYTERRITWRSPQGKEVSVIVRRMASFTQKELFLLDYQVTPLNFSGTITIEGEENADVTNFANPDDPRVAAEALKHLHVLKAERQGDTTLMTAATTRSGLQVACAVGYTTQGHFAGEVQREGGRIITSLSAQVQEKETVGLCKWCILCDSRRHENPEETALRLLHTARNHPLSHWFSAQEERLTAFWQLSRVEAETDKPLQQSLDYSLYTLFCSAGQDGISNVAAKGLSGEGYEGHYFWDTEIYILPFFLLTNRPIAKALLSYRYYILPKARAHARLMGHPIGALYAWRTIEGSECSGYYPSGSAQYHLTGDVAHSFVQYYLATDDLDLMEEMGAEVLVETARLWLDAGHWQDGHFRIDAVTGPDEYTCIVNNNFYTNAVAKENLHWAAKIIKRLQKFGRADALCERLHITQEELSLFTKAAKGMYLPYDEQLGIHAQDDSFLQKKKVDIASLPQEKFPLLMHYHPLWLYRHQVCKQADTVLAHYLYDNLATRDVMRRTLHYYEEVTTHDSSLSTCVFCIQAARLGDMDKALNYFERTATLDLDDTHGNTRDGIHTANMGGCYLSVVMGFAGLRIREEGLFFTPRLPKGWTRYAFRFQYKNSTLSLAVRKGRCTLALLAGPPVSLYINKEKIKIKDQAKVAL